MKKSFKKAAAITVSILLAAGMLPLSGCGAINMGNTDSSSAASGQTESGQETVYGKITSVSDDSVTITVGTLDSSGKLTLGSETRTFSVTDSTLYSGSTQVMGGQSGDMSGGTMPDGGAPGQNGTGTDSGDSGTTPPAKPDGDMSGGAMPGQNGTGTDSGDSGTTPPAKPGSDMSGGAMPDQNGTGTDSGDSGTTPPAKPGSDMSGGAMPGGDLSGQDGMGGQGGNRKESRDGLTKGAEISVVLNSDGTAASVTFLSETGGAANSSAGGDMSGDSSEKAEGQLGSWNMGGTDAASTAGNDYDYSAALYVTSDGVDQTKSVTDRISGGTFDGSSASSVTIEDTASGDNGILIDNAEYTVKDAVINLLTNASGTDTCDFSGKGTAVAVFGSKSKVTVDNTKIHTSGVATMPVFADDGATVTVKNSVLQSDGGTLYKAYMNSPAQTLMAAPPWILGIMGTSRCSNMMGSNTTSNFIDSETSAGAWAVLSTDSGSNMALNIFNTSLTLNNKDESRHLLQESGGQIAETLDNPYTVNYGSGYGTYAIGNAVEIFAGATLNVGTYATIFTGGSAVYSSLEKGKTYELRNAADSTVYSYTAAENKATVINSDTFGFMAHQNTNSISIESGTSVKSGFATFLVKSGASNEQLTATADGADITNGGVLIQVMDNDDTTNGGMMAADDAANTNGGSQNFIPTHTETAGFPKTQATADSTKQEFTFTNGNYSGNIYNASGSNGLKATALNVNLGTGASLSGAAASTASVHCTYDGSALVKRNGGFAYDSDDMAADFARNYQNTSFSISEYFGIGEVANKIYSNGGNSVNMSLTEDAIWNVTGTSLISSLSIDGSAKVVVADGTTLTVGGKDYSGTTLTAADF